jgi:hypothetical protein
MLDHKQKDGHRVQYARIMHTVAAATAVVVMVKVVVKR